MSSTNTTVEQRSAYRLPPAVVPLFYDMKIEPDLDKFTFAGEEKIEVEVREPTREVVLNSADIKIHEAILSDKTGTRLVGLVHHDELSERATIAFDGTAGTGEWELDLKFSGIINDKLKGFYRSLYKDASGKEQVIATTKFEPCDARRAFPCFDEPAMKARFKVSLVIDEHLTGMSNMRLLKSTPLGNGKKLLEFARTPRLSSYLVAYRVGNFVASKPVRVDGKEVRVFCVPGKEHMTDFALTCAKFALEYFSNYFQHAYCGDKLDLVAIPDFASGAMEDFGIPAFRETALLLDPKTASHAELLRVSEVIFHEIAHMWFGDFVTMKWWNGLWLNEAFATFMAAKCMHAYNKEWKFWENFNVDRAGAMKVDGLIETRSIEFPVNMPEEARQMFDVLTYEKGCALLRMLELFLGEENFRHGIVNYLSKHQFDNADTGDLWEAIEEVVPGFSDKVNVTALMNSWIFQPGFPVIAVDESDVTGSIRLSQHIFRYLDDGNKPNTTWHIPVHLRATVAGANGEPETIDKVVLLSQPSETFYIGENITSVVVNAGGHGFYRVHYSDDLRKKLLGNLAALTASERFNFVNDLWASVQSGQSALKDYLNTVTTLTHDFGESDVNVFSVVLGSLGTLHALKDNNAAARPGVVASDKLSETARRILTPCHQRLGFAVQAGETPQQGQLRGRVMAALGEYGDETVIAHAGALFGKWKQDKTAVDGNLIGPVVSCLAANGDEQRYDEFVALKKAAATPQEEQRFLMSLALFRHSSLAARTLQSCIDGNVRTQDAPLLVQQVLSNTAVAGRNADGKPVTISAQAWEFIKNNWETMVGKYPMQGVSRLCSGVTALATPELENDVKGWFAGHHVKGGEKSVRQYLEQLAINVRLAQREADLLV